MMANSILPSASRATVGEIAADHQEARIGQVFVHFWESRVALRVHIVPKFGKRPVSSVTLVLVERFLSWQIGPDGGANPDHSAGPFSSMRSAPGASEPCPRHVRLARPLLAHRERREFQPFTLDLLLAVVEQQREYAGAYADITLVLGLTAVRLGELRGLRVRDITDVPYPGLVVKRSVPQSVRTGRPVERATTKSGRRRVVPLADLVQPVIAAWAAGKQPDDLLFPSPQGTYLRTGTGDG